MVLIIAEAGVNHNGSLILAKELIDAASCAGADVIKFQSFDATKLVTKNAKKARYQIINTSNDDSQLKMLKKLQLTYEEQIELKSYADKKNIEFLSTAFDIESVHFLNKLNLKRFKIPSGEITNLPYLRLIGSLKKPIILSTGMSNMIEIRQALNELCSRGSMKEDISILHCTTQYPAPYKDINLRAIETLKREFNTKIGYSDHSAGIEVSLAAVALGAQIIEKHITIDKNLDGPDHKASIEPNQLQNLVKSIRNISLAMGSNEKKISKSELENLRIARKSIVSRVFIKKGEVFTEENLCTKRPAEGISPMEWDKIIGKKAKKDFQVDDFIET